MTSSPIPPPPDRHVPLCALRAGECGRVHATCNDHEECELLRAMGINEHCVLRVCRGGEPCIIEVNNTRLALSGVLARGIRVAPIRPTANADESTTATPRPIAAIAPIAPAPREG